MEEPQELETLAMAKRSEAALSEVERSVFRDRDQQDLARLGKRQVLKVRPIDQNFLLRPYVLTNPSGTLASCQCWALVAP